MKYSKLSFLVFGILIAKTATAYTECTDVTIEYIFNDGGNTFIGFTPNSDTLHGSIRSSQQEYKTLVSIAIAARTTGKKVKVRFLEDNLNCNSTPWNASIVGIGF